MLYKYRILDDYKNIVDILVKKRLFAAKFSELNDPMEGHYIYSPNSFPEEVINKIKERKNQTRIVSLSRSYNIFLMWSHYAGGHSGIVIGVEVDKLKYKVKEVSYYNELPRLSSIKDLPLEEFTENVLCCIHSLWKYEEEERILVVDGSTFADVEVKEIIIGKKMSNQNYSLLKDLVTKVDSKIKLKRIEELDNNFDYNVEVDV